MTIRLANTTDLPALNAIYRDIILTTEATCYSVPPSDDEWIAWWQTHQDPHLPVFAAEDDGRIVGYASLSWWVNGPVYAHTVEISVYLDAAARGRGMGKALTQAILNHARTLKHHVVISRIWANNAPSVALFVGLGFETIGTLREVGFRNGLWEDCLVMQLTL